MSYGPSICTWRKMHLFPQMSDTSPLFKECGKDLFQRFLSLSYPPVLGFPWLNYPPIPPVSAQKFVKFTVLASGNPATPALQANPQIGILRNTCTLLLCVAGVTEGSEDLSGMNLALSSVCSRHTRCLSKSQTYLTISFLSLSIHFFYQVPKFCFHWMKSKHICFLFEHQTVRFIIAELEHLAWTCDPSLVLGSHYQGESKKTPEDCN